MPDPISIYPEDLSGVAPTNLIQNEPHVLGATTVRVVVPDYGPFFTESVVLKDAADPGVALVKGVDYKCVEISEELNVMTGKEVAAVILVYKQGMSTNALLTYQTPGGRFTRVSTQTLNDLYAAVVSDERPVEWENVLNPLLTYPPSMHPHLLADLYRFQSLIVGLERLQQAVTLSNVPAFERAMLYVKEQRDLVNAAGAVPAIEQHNLSNGSHADIRESIGQKAYSSGNMLPDVCSGLWAVFWYDEQSGMPGNLPVYTDDITANRLGGLTFSNDFGSLARQSIGFAFGYAVELALRGPFSARETGVMVARSFRNVNAQTTFSISPCLDPTFYPGFIPVVPGFRYELQGRLAATQAKTRLGVLWRDSGNQPLPSNQTSYSDWVENAGVTAAIHSLSDMTWRGIFVTAPAGAHFAEVFLETTTLSTPTESWRPHNWPDDPNPAAISPCGFLKDGYFGIATATQTIFSKFSPGPGMPLITAKQARHQILDESLHGRVLMDNGVNGSKLIDNSVSGAKLAEDSVASGKLQAIPMSKVTGLSEAIAGTGKKSLTYNNFTTLRLPIGDFSTPGANAFWNLSSADGANGTASGVTSEELLGILTDGAGRGDSNFSVIVNIDYYLHIEFWKYISVNAFSTMMFFAQVDVDTPTTVNEPILVDIRETNHYLDNSDLLVHSGTMSFAFKITDEITGLRLRYGGYSNSINLVHPSYGRVNINIISVRE